MSEPRSYQPVGRGSSSPPDADIDATLRALDKRTNATTRTWYEACECCILETVRIIAVAAVYIAFYVVPFAVYVDRERQIPEVIRHTESFSVSTMRSHSMYAWDNLSADGERHRSVLRSQDYYAFTFFVQMINLLCWFPWTLLRYFRDGRDAFMGVFAVTVLATSFYHLLEQEVGVQGLMQLESTAFSLALGFVVRESSPPRFSGRMAFTLFCLWDFLNQKLGFRVYSFAGWTLHVALALFLWAYTNYTHQLYPGSLIINYMACMALIRFFNYWSDHETRTQEIVRVQHVTRDKDALIVDLIRKLNTRMNTSREERVLQTMSQGLMHVPERMRMSHPRQGPDGDGDTSEVGFTADGSDMRVFINRTEDDSDEDAEELELDLGPMQQRPVTGSGDADDDVLFPDGHGAGAFAPSSAFSASPPSLTQDQKGQLMELSHVPTKTRSRGSRAQSSSKKQRGSFPPPAADAPSPTSAPADTGPKSRRARGAGPQSATLTHGTGEEREEEEHEVPDSDDESQLLPVEAGHRA